MIEKIRCPLCRARVKLVRITELDRHAVACRNTPNCALQGPARRRRADAIQSFQDLGRATPAQARELRHAEAESSKFQRRCDRLERKLAAARAALAALQPLSLSASPGSTDDSATLSDGRVLNDEVPNDASSDEDPSPEEAESPLSASSLCRESGKRGFRSRRQARRSIAGSASWRAGIYFCEICAAWHVANYDKRGSGEGQRRRRSGPYRRPPPGSDPTIQAPFRRRIANVAGPHDTFRQVRPDGSSAAPDFKAT